MLQNCKVSVLYAKKRKNFHYYFIQHDLNEKLNKTQETITMK